MKNINKSPRISFFKFWIFLAVVYALVFETIEFSDSPVSGFGGYAAILSQWFVVSLFASSVIGLMSLCRWVFIFVFPIFMFLSGIMAYYTVTMGIHLTGSIIELMAVNDTSTWATVVSFSLVALSVVSLGIGVAIGLYRFHCVNSASRRWIWFVAFLALMLSPIYAIKRFQAPVAGRVPYAFWISCKEYFDNRHDEEYGRNWPEKIKALRANKSKEFDTEIYFHSVIDAASIRTSVMDSTKSIFRP